MGTHEDITQKWDVKPPSARSFAWVWAGFLTLVGCWPLWKGAGPRWWSLGAAAVFLLIGLLKPALLDVPNRLWFRAGLLLGHIIAPIVTGVVFFLVVTPLGILARLLGKDLLRLRWDPAADSYWIPRTPPGPPPETMTNQF